MVNNLAVEVSLGSYPSAKNENCDFAKFENLVFKKWQFFGSLDTKARVKPYKKAYLSIKM